MATEPEEVDYLAGTKPFPKIASFAEEVREAFALEHKTQQDQDIAPYLNVTAGRVSQILKEPWKLKAETVQKILGCFKSVTHRRSILKAWQRECFGEDVSDPDSASLIGEAPTERTIKRIDRLVRTMRPDRALKVTEQALSADLAPEFRRQLLDRAFYLYQRLDQQGDAMGVAQGIFEKGRADNHREDIALGLAMKGRVLRSLDSVDFEALRNLQEEVAQILDSLPATALASKGGVAFHKRSLRSAQISTVLKYQEELGGADEFLDTALREVETRVRAADTPKQKSGAFQLEARIHLARREYFKAEDILEESFKLGDITLGIDAHCGIIRAKIIAARGNTDEAIDYYEKLCKLCEAERHIYLLRLSQRDLAVLKASKFPPSRPV